MNDCISDCPIVYGYGICFYTFFQMKITFYTHKHTHISTISMRNLLSFLTHGVFEYICQDHARVYWCMFTSLLACR